MNSSKKLAETVNTKDGRKTPASLTVSGLACYYMAILKIVRNGNDGAKKNH